MKLLPLGDFSKQSGPRFVEGKQIQADLLGGWQLQKVLRPFLPLFGRFDAAKLPNIRHICLGVGLNLMQQLLAVVLLLSGDPVKVDQLFTGLIQPVWFVCGKALFLEQQIDCLSIFLFFQKALIFPMHIENGTGNGTGAVLRYALQEYTCIPGSAEKILPLGKQIFAVTLAGIATSNTI